MSYRVPFNAEPQDDSGSSSGEEDRLSDWASSLGEALQTKSLFSSKTFPNANAAIESDTKEHGFNIKDESTQKGLDLYGRMRLINWIRRNVGDSGPFGFDFTDLQGASAEQAKALDGREKLFQDEELLIPVIPDDPLLRMSNQAGLLSLVADG